MWYVQQCVSAILGFDVNALYRFMKEVKINMNVVPDDMFARRKYRC